MPTLILKKAENIVDVRSIDFINLYFIIFVFLFFIFNILK